MSRNNKHDDLRIKQVNSDFYTKLKSTLIAHIEIGCCFDHAHKTALPSMPTTKQVIFGPHTEINSISTTHTQTESFDPTPQNTFFFGQYTRTKPISIPLALIQWIHAHKANNFCQAHKNEVNFDTPKPKPSQFRSTHSNQLDFDRHPKNKSIPIPALKQENFDLPHNWSYFDHPHKNRVHFDAHTKPSQPTKNKSISTTRTKNKSFDPHVKNNPFSTRAPKPSPFRSQTKSISTYTLKLSSVRGADENKFNSDRPQIKIKPISIQNYKQVKFDTPQKIKDNFHTIMEIKSFSMPPVKRSRVWRPKAKTGQFRPTQKQVNFETPYWY